jgi:MtN3 and saliva related transmembrane protein
MDALGYAAGILTCSALVPQLVQVLRTRSAKDISYAMLFTMIVGQTLWIVHGIANRDIPIVLFTGFSLTMNAAILAMKFMIRDSASGKQCNYELVPV